MTRLLIEESPFEGKRVVAGQLIARGEPVLRIYGIRVRKASRHSLQIGVRTHIVLGPETDPGTALWPFLEHACRPNCRLEGTTVRAIRDIAAGEPPTINYNATEWQMNVSFMCHCDASAEPHRIAGYATLDPEQRARIGPLVADHLLQLERTEHERAAGD